MTAKEQGMEPGLRVELVALVLLKRLDEHLDSSIRFLCLRTTARHKHLRNFLTLRSVGGGSSNVNLSLTQCVKHSYWKRSAICATVFFLDFNLFNAAAYSSFINNQIP